MIAVLGASGFLGMHTLRALPAGAPIRAIARRNTAWLRALGHPVVPADLDRPSTLLPALAGVRVLVHAAGHYPQRSIHPDDTLVRAVNQTRALADAAAAAGVERVVLLSSVATVAPAVGRPSDELDRRAVPPGFGPYHDAKWWIEEILTHDDRFTTTVLCPGACLGPGDWRLGTQGALLALARGRAVALPDGWVNPVDAADVGRAAAVAATQDDLPLRLHLAERSLHVVDLLQQVQERCGLGGKIRLLPVEAARELADAKERRADFDGRRPALSREVVDLLAHGVDLDTRLAERALGFTWTPLWTTIDRFLAWSGTSAGARRVEA